MYGCDVYAMRLSPCSLCARDVCLGSDRIERSALDGNYREVLVDSAVHPFGLALHGHHIYWTDWILRGVFRAEKHTGANQQVLVRGLPKRPMDIHVYSTSRQQQCK